MTAVTRSTTLKRPPQLRAALVVASVALLMLSGCTRDASDLHEYISQTKQRPATPIESLPEMKPQATFAYPDSLTRDPFRPPQLEEPQGPVASGPSPDQDRVREELEAFPLDSLRMMGTLQQQGRLWALVKDPEGTIHRVETGNYLGQNYGEIVAIEDYQVVLNELIPNGKGGWMERRAALAVATKDD